MNRFLQLQHRFLDGVERRLAEMTAELDHNADAGALMRMFHSLAGIGGTFGFPRVSEISSKCEALCAAAAEGQRPMLSAEKISLHLAVAAIRGITAARIEKSAPLFYDPSIDTLRRETNGTD
jgi:chemotaxis protein histidine kinase CheA